MHTTENTHVHTNLANKTTTPMLASALELIDGMHRPE